MNPSKTAAARLCVDFPRKNEVPWPQYYQGQGYDSAFSTAWGVGSAPTLFLIDRQGRLQGTPSPEQLEDSIAALLQPGAE